MNQNNTSKKKLTKKQESILYSVIIAVLALILAGLIMLLLHEPHVDNTPSFPTDTSSSGGEDIDVSVEPYQRKDDFYTVLIAGVDDVSMSTDVLMLASLDAKNGEIKIVQIPRDTFVNAEVGGFTTVHRANAIFTGEYNRKVNSGVSAKTSKTLAMQALSAHLEKTLCVTIDEYVLLDTSAFCDIIDAFGGVMFDVPFDMHYEDPEQDLYIDLKAGYQHLDGAKCEQFIRYRSGYGTGDIQRMEMRADLLRALFAQIKSNMNVSTALDIIRDKSLLQKLNTSMSLVDLFSYVRMVYAADGANMEIRTIAGEVLQAPDGVWRYFCLNKKGALEDINECLNVYENDITLGQFDTVGFFTDSKNEENAYIHEYYLSDEE